jgi:hypothetical protein
VLRLPHHNAANHSGSCSMKGRAENAIAYR